MSDTYTNLNDASTEVMSTLAEPKVVLRDYVLPPATDTTLGGVIVGDGLSVDVNGNLSATGQRKMATETFYFTIENSNEKILLIQDFDMKISGKEIAMIEVLEGETWKNLDVISAEDFVYPSVRINKYVVYDGEYNCDVLAYYYAFEGRPAWYIASPYSSVRVTYYI